MIVTSLIHVVIQTSRIDLSLIASIAFSFLVFLGFTLMFDATCVTCLFGQSSYKLSYHAFRQGTFWLTNLLTIIVAMLPRYCVKFVYNSIGKPLLEFDEQNNTTSRARVTHL